MLPSVGTPELWAGFILGVLVLLVVDLGIVHRSPHRVGLREAGLWSLFWVIVSLAFNGFLWVRFGKEAGMAFLSAYLVEKSLSVDNLFVFLVIFRYMCVRPALMHRVLFAGIVGALLLRALFILAGIELIRHFDWTLYVFGGFLILTGIKLFLPGEETFDPAQNIAYRLARRVMRLTREYHGTRFFVSRNGRLHATPLFLVLLMVETSDVIFALDSIPAVFGITLDPFLVFSSNVCAVMGLRAMFFLLQHVIDRFGYLKFGLGLVLAFIGAKMVLEQGLGPLLPPVHVSIGLSLGIVAGLLLLSIAASLLLPAPGPGVDERLEDQAEASLVRTPAEISQPNGSPAESGPSRPVPPGG